MKRNTHHLSGLAYCVMERCRKMQHFQLTDIAKNAEHYYGWHCQVGNANLVKHLLKFCLLKFTSNLNRLALPLHDFEFVRTAFILGV